MSNLAKYADPVEVIRDSIELGKHGTLMTTAPDGDTMDRIATLLRTGIKRGIYPRWSLRHELGVKFEQADLDEIAGQVEEGFTSGEVPEDWRIDVYQ